MMKKAKHVCANKFAGEGARGGCFFVISPGDKPETAFLDVGWSCVVVHQKDIPISWLSEIIAIATSHKDGIPGFLREHHYGDSDKGYALMVDPEGAA